MGDLLQFKKREPTAGDKLLSDIANQPPSDADIMQTLFTLRCECQTPEELQKRLAETYPNVPTTTISRVLAKLSE